MLLQRQRLESGVGITSGLTQPEEHKTNFMKHLHPSALMSQLYHDVPGQFFSYKIILFYSNCITHSYTIEQ